MKSKTSPSILMAFLVIVGILGSGLASARVNVQIGFVAGGPAYSPGASYSTHDYYLSPNSPPPVMVPPPQVVADAKKGNGWFCADAKADYSKECSGSRKQSR